MTKEDAADLVRTLAKDIERGELVPELMKGSPEYCETYRRNYPVLLNQAADLLEGKATPDAEGASRDCASRKREFISTALANFEGGEEVTRITLVGLKTSKAIRKAFDEAKQRALGLLEVRRVAYRARS